MCNIGVVYLFEEFFKICMLFVVYLGIGKEMVLVFFFEYVDIEIDVFVEMYIGEIF